MRRPTLAALFASALAAAGCGHGHTSHVPPPPAGPPVYDELEPNDSPLHPDFIGFVDRFTLLYVYGHVQAFGFDLYDHIEFESVAPATYDFRVRALSAFGDVDVFVYDPLAGVIVGEYTASGPSEYGRVVVHQHGRPFQLIVSAYGYDTRWELELVGRPYTGYLAATGGPGLGPDADDSAGAGEDGGLSPIEAHPLRPEDFEALAPPSLDPVD